MASIFDKVSRSGYDTVKKIKKATEASSARACIAEEEKKIEQYYKMIGKFCFEEYSKMSSTPAEPYNAWFAEINKGLSKINSLEEEIRALQGMLCCPECGKTMKSDAIFCGFCGANLATAKENIIVARYCPNCGEEAPDGNAFCAKCGHKL